jgi:hypothetical protein
MLTALPWQASIGFGHSTLRSKKTRLIHTHNAICKLQAAISAACDGQESEEESGRSWKFDAPPTEWQTHLRALKDNIVEVINPPTAMGSGHRGLAHKVGNLVFGWSLQTDDMIDIGKVASSFRSHTSDMGVELSIPDFQVPNISTLLPEWLHRGALEADLPDAARDDSDHGAPSEISEPCDVDGAHFDSDESAATPIADMDEQAAPPPPPPPVDERDNDVSFLPNSLTVPGLQHIMNNLCNDVHKHLHHWTHFWDELKNLEALLVVSERRQRFVWTCLRGSHLQHRDRMFNKFTGSLYEARWRAVLDFLSHLVPLLRVLAARWNAESFIRGRGGRNSKPI